MAGGNKVRAVFQSRLQKQLKLDLLVAHDIWIRRKAGLKAFEHVIQYLLTVFFLKIVNFERNAKLDSQSFSVLIVFLPRAWHAGQIAGPIFHVNTRDAVTLLL